ncbi:hypothetical protein DCC79_01120 [bacterium]|nr:hypothetical protein [Chloroflexi bacterium CFX6]RIL12522.1 MAG: hypothetical protein DCC79_01120 [bacterium]
MIETAVLFGHHAALVGVLAEPDPVPAAADRPAVIILDAGRIHHVGPNRLHVKLARRLAAEGFTVLRFDFSGIGDSAVREDHAPFRQSVVAETREAMAFLGAVRGLRRFVLLGLCSGAATALRAGLDDARVVGTVLINVRGPQHDRWTTARAYTRKLFRHYWKVIVLNPRGALRPSRIAPDLERWKAAYQTRRARRVHPAAPAVADRGGGAPVLDTLLDRGFEVLMVFSEADVGLDFLHVRSGADLPRWLATGRFAVEVVEGADHVFTRLTSQARLVDACSAWMARFEGSRAAPERDSPGVG